MEYIYDSEEFKNTGIYKNFTNINQGSGILKVEASVASGAYPLEGVNIKVYKDFGNDRVIFYEGVTNSSGIIDNIILPTKELEKEINEVSDIDFTTYDLEASYSKYDLEKMYDVSIFDDIKVIQPITFPIDELVDGDNNG